MTLSQKLVQGSYVTLICMLIVFLVLVGLNYIIRLQRVIIEKIEGIKAEKPQPVPVEPETEQIQIAEENDDELVAVITAAVAAVMGRPTSEIIVRSIRSSNTGAPSWAAAGRQDQINSRF